MNDPTPTLAGFMRESQAAPFLRMGPPAPLEGWVYRDFTPMPQAMWLELMALLGEDQVRIVACNVRQQPPAAMCRAQIWIGPQARVRWRAYLDECELVAGGGNKVAAHA